MTNATPLDDDRLRFYLRHRERIEEWAALGREVRQATLATFIGFGTLIEPLAVELGADLRLDDELGNLPGWMLRKPHWPEANNDALVSVVLEVERASVDPSSSSTAPYVGIRIRDPLQAGAALRAALAPLAKRDDLKDKGYRGGSGTSWPVFRRVVAGSSWWEDADSWGDLLRAALRDAWADLAPPVDEAVAQLSS